MCVCMYVCMHACMYIFMYACMCICMHASMYVCMLVYVWGLITSLTTLNLVKRATKSLLFWVTRPTSLINLTANRTLRCSFQNFSLESEITNICCTCNELQCVIIVTLHSLLCRNV
jgi:hypothetical protein